MVTRSCSCTKTSTMSPATCGDTLMRCDSMNASLLIECVKRYDSQSMAQTAAASATTPATIHRTRRRGRGASVAGVALLMTGPTTGSREIGQDRPADGIGQPGQRRLVMVQCRGVVLLRPYHRQLAIDHVGRRGVPFFEQAANNAQDSRCAGNRGPRQGDALPGVVDEEKRRLHFVGDAVADLLAGGDGGADIRLGGAQLADPTAALRKAAARRSRRPRSDWRRSNPEPPGVPRCRRPARAGGTRACATPAPAGPSGSIGARRRIPRDGPTAICKHCPRARSNGGSADESTTCVGELTLMPIAWFKPATAIPSAVRALT